MNFYFFLTGITLTIIGWFIEQAELFRWLRKLIAPTQTITLESLDLLKQDEVIQTDSTQGKILLSIWPILNEKTRVKYIARSVPYISFGDIIKNDIQLVAYEENKKELGRWSMSEAKKILNDRLHKKFFVVGALIFWAGIIIGFFSGLAEFIEENNYA